MTPLTGPEFYDTLTKLVEANIPDDTPLNEPDGWLTDKLLANIRRIMLMLAEEYLGERAEEDIKRLWPEWIGKD